MEIWRFLTEPAETAEPLNVMGLLVPEWSYNVRFLKSMLTP